MSQETTFGRRQQRVVRPPAPDDMTLNTAVEAFRTEFAARGLDEVAAFGDWRRSQRNRRLMTALLSAALMCPGLICWVMSAPWYVSALLEVVGIGLGFWLRAERRQQLNAIATWDAAPDELTGRAS